jgi:imidazole glycerol-phosphate synthase subunit HisH
MIGILNYGLGNVSAFVNIYNKMGVAAKLVEVQSDLIGVNKLILPGVGAFDYAMRCFNDSGLREEVDRLVLIEKVPILGVCVGLQMMAEFSDEGVLCGLGWIDATVVKFDSKSLPVGSPLPHMGWNNLQVVKEDPIFAGLDDSKFYYLHSFYIVPKNQEQVIGSSRYGEKFCCVLRSDNIYGMQSHPEKSHSFGVRFLKNFAEM